MIPLENSLVYYPERYPSGLWQPEELAFEDAQFQAADGTSLHGWFVPHPAPRAVILFAHGNGGNLTYWADDLRNIHRRAAASVMIFDYRGYGKSQGRPNESGVLQDARAARRWLAQRSAVRPAEIVLLGCSLGGGVMVDLAAADGARGLVLQNTFTSLVDVAREHFPWAPVGLLMRNRFDSLHKISRYHGPLLQSHAAEDSIVPYRLGEKLYAAANSPKQFLAIAGADHNEPPPIEYWTELARFLDQLPDGEH